MLYQTISPTSGAVLETFNFISDEDLDAALAQAHRCYETVWRATTIAERGRILQRAAAALRENVQDYARIVTLEMGKLVGTAAAEVMLSASILEYYANRAADFLAPQPIPGVPGARVETRPLGVIFGIEPWNFPYYQVARVVAPQLMVGNVVVIKPSECVPQSALAFARLMAEAGVPQGAFTTVFATIEQSARIIDDPRVAAVTLTGSERAGKAVGEQAGRSLKKCVLELGGSDPFVILEDADMEEAIEGAVFGRMFNTGQSCAASKRIIVIGRERGRAFIEGFTARLAALAAGDPMDPATTLGPVASDRALRLLLEQIALARHGGARVILGGNRLDRPGFYLEPTVLTDIARDNPVFSQELFGPVAAVHVVESEDQAVALANGTPYGLSASVFTADPARGRRFAERIESGMVFVNQPTWTAPELPFGGIKNSGFGRELSDLGFGEFVNRKLVSLAPPGAPPWGPAPAPAEHPAAS